jgi:PAS domain S-box-containing protein
MHSPSSILSDKTLLDILYQSPTATAIYTGEALQIAFANAAMRKLWNITDEDIIGKTYAEIRAGHAPNLISQLPRVWQTGITYTEIAAPYMLRSNGYIYTQYYNIELKSIKDSKGHTEAIIHTAVSLNRTGIAQFIDEAENKHKQPVSNNDQKTVERLNERFDFDNSIFQTILDNATIGVVIITGDDNRVAYANRSYSRMISRDLDALPGNRLFDILPEAEAYFRPIIDEVRNTGLPIYLYDTPYTINNNGNFARGYVNVIYQPFTHPVSGVKSMLAICHDITAQTLNKRETEELANQLQTTNYHLQLDQEGLRLAVDTAQLGIWSADLQTQLFELDARCRSLFGFDADEQITKADIDSVLDERYKSLITQTVQDALKGKPGMVEYYVINRKTGKRSWIRGSAKYIPPTSGADGRLVGILIDLSAEKDEEQRKTDFIGFVSHELRSPLTSLSGFIQVLQLKAAKVGDEKVKDIVVKSRRQVDRMAALISGFLDVVKMGEGRIQLDLSVFDLSELLSASEEESATIVQTHQMVYKPVTGAVVEADYDKIEQVLTNLINNAVKYSPQGTTITVAAKCIDHEVQVSIADEGLGISPADIPHLFDRFYRAQSEHIKTIKGFGIGLYICKEIIESHNGRIWVESEVDKGSVFYFSLPLASVQA